MIFWMIATLTTHHKMVNWKKPWLSYRTTCGPRSPAPPRARNSALVRTTKTARGPERSRLSHFLRFCCCVFFSPWSQISTSLSGSDLGLAWLGLAGGEKPKPRPASSSSSSSFRVIAGSFFVFILSQRSQLRSCSIGGNDWFPGSFSLPQRRGWPGIPHFSQPKKNHKHTHQLNRCRQSTFM